MKDVRCRKRKPRHHAHIGEYRINHRFDPKEPMPCMAKRCKEEINGLHNFWINIGGRFPMDIWLCQDCAKKFRDTVTDDAV